MKKFTLAALLLAATAQAQEAPEVLIGEARAQTKGFAEELKLTLMAGMKADGPVAAISLCNTQAPALAEKHSKEGWQVGRTSEKLRNPDNAPDTWEQEVLTSFASQASAGVDIATLEAWTQDGDQFRYMKAIEVGGPCVVCHGQNLSPTVTSALDALYPQDNARGYLPGQLRGAFTLTYIPENH